MNLNIIRNVIAEQWRLFEQEYNSYTSSDIDILNEVNEYLRQRSGKRLRPLLLLLSNAGADTQRATKYAVAMEMLHNASLMHDDVVDDDDMRRGQESVKGRWGNQVAVLCGDYYLATVMSILSEMRDEKALRLVNDTVITMSAGELLQQQYIHSGNLDEKLYFDIIFRKTAVLMQTCCTLGNEGLHLFGGYFGTAFQLRDDVMDYDESGSMLKPSVEVLRSKLSEQVNFAIAELDKQQPSPCIDALRSLTLQLLVCNE